MHPLLLEIKFADLLRLARDPQAPIAREFDISAAFDSLDLNNNFEMKFNVQDFGPQGSRNVHELVFQINTKKAKDKINKIQNLYKLVNNTGALKAFLISGIFLNGEIQYNCSCECFVADTLVKMLDGTDKKIGDLIKGEKYWIYSSDENGNFTPKLATALGITKHVDKLVEVTLDNGKIEKCSMNHLWRLRDGSYKEAYKLSSGDSLMPLYTEKNKSGYEVIIDNDSKKKNTHSIVNKIINEQAHLYKQEWIKSKNNTKNDKYLVTHHKDFNKNNNEPANLEWMGMKEHYLYHANLIGENKKRIGNKLKELWKDSEFYAKHVDQQRANGKKNNFSNNPEALKKAIIGVKNSQKLKNVNSLAMKEKWKDPEFREKAIESCKKNAHKLWNDEKYEEFRKKWSESARKRVIENNKKNVEQNTKRIIELNKNPALNRIRCISRIYNTFDKMKNNNIEINEENFIKNKARRCPHIKKYFNDIQEALEFYNKRNHKVLSIRIIDVDNEPLYDLYVPDTHNFALSSGVYVHNSFVYGGFKYMANKNRDGIGIPSSDENKKPVIRNPNLRGRICKHGIGVIANLNSFHNRIFTALQVQLKNELKKVEQERKKTPLPKTPVKSGTNIKNKKPGQKKNIITTDVEKYYPIRVIDKYPKWIKIKLNMSNIDVDQWENKLKQGLK